MHPRYKICFDWLMATELVGWLVVLRIYVALAIFRPYLDLQAGVTNL